MKKNFFIISFLADLLSCNKSAAAFLNLKKSFFIVSFLAAISPTRVLLSEAQLPTVTVTPSPTVTPPPVVETINFSQRQKMRVDYYQLMADMLLSRRGLGSTTDQELIDDKLTVIYEKLSELYCMPYLLKTLQYEGNPTHPKCLEYLSKLEEIFQGSPIIPCAKHGIDSEECKSAYSDQYIDVLDLEKIDPEDLALTTKIKAQMLEQDIPTLNNQIIDSIKQYRELKANKAGFNELIKVRRQIEKQHSDLIALQCNTSLTKIVHQEPAPEKNIAYKKSNKLKDPKLNNLLKELTVRTPQPSPTPTPTRLDRYKEYDPFNTKNRKQTEVASKKEQRPTWRIRLLTTTCQKAIDDAKSFSKQIPAATCARYGDFTPACVTSWRNKKKALDIERMKLQRKNPQTSSGFSTF